LGRSAENSAQNSARKKLKKARREEANRTFFFFRALIFALRRN